MSSADNPAPPELLTADRIAELRPTLPGWEWDEDVIRRVFTAPTFLGGVKFVHQIALEAEERDHHPDIDIRWRTITIALSTHSVGGLTRLDTDLAVEIDRLFDAAAR